MRILACLGLAAVSACTLYFDHGHKQVCNEGGIAAVGEIAQQQLRNPDNLVCESFGGQTCDPNCGPCPLAREAPEALPPEPTWGVCGSQCDGLDETTCSSKSECRIVRDLACAVSGSCTTDYIGCFPTDMVIDPTVVCLKATDGETCSRNAKCTAFHRAEACDSVQCEHVFSLCMDQGASPGKCFAPTTCDIASPACPTGTTPGIVNGCFSGACIPMDLCEPPPPMP